MLSYSMRSPDTPSRSEAVSITSTLLPCKNTQNTLPKHFPYWHGQKMYSCLHHHLSCTQYNKLDGDTPFCVLSIMIAFMMVPSTCLHIPHQPKTNTSTNNKNIPRFLYLFVVQNVFNLFGQRGLNLFEIDIMRERFWCIRGLVWDLCASPWALSARHSSWDGSLIVANNMSCTS